MLKQNIEELPVLIKNAYDKEQSLQNDQDDTKALMEKIELLAIQHSVLGRNDTERKQMNLTFLQEHKTYSDYEAKYIKLKREVAMAHGEFEYQKNRFKAADILSRRDD